MGTYLSAEIMNVGDGKELDNDNFVLNVESKHQAVSKYLGTEDKTPRITIFGDVGREALAKLKAGARVIFTGIKRNPRSWISENSGKSVEAVELIAEGFKIVKKGEFDDLAKMIRDGGDMFDAGKLEFTDEDRKRLADEASALAKKDDPDSKADI